MIIMWGIKFTSDEQAIVTQKVVNEPRCSVPYLGTSPHTERERTGVTQGEGLHCVPHKPSPGPFPQRHLHPVWAWVS